jgi:hypothetical protein
MTNNYPNCLANSNGPSLILVASDCLANPKRESLHGTSFSFPTKYDNGSNKAGAGDPRH